MNDDNSNSPRRSILLYGALLLIAFFLVQYYLMPQFSEPKIAEVTYNTFLDKLDSGLVTEVKLDEGAKRIEFIATDPKDDTKTESFYTGLILDNSLVDRLRDSKTKDGKKIAFRQAVPAENSFIINFFLTFVLPLLLVGTVGYFIMRTVTKRMGNDSMAFGKSNAKMYVKAQTGITFADVAGQDEAKEDLREIVDFLHNPAKYKTVGAIMPKGALLVGPPGTGKTLLAKAVAGEAGVPFFSIAGSAFVEMFVGRGAARVRDLFKEAKDKSPCIVFIDELDTIGKKRDGGGFSGNDEREQTLNQLLSEMDGFDGGSGVVILAATNRPETLDAALLRPGRFDRRIPVELPDLAGREAILQVHAKKIVLDNNIDYISLARATSGASGADLANIINEGALRAVKHNRRVVTQDDLMESVETIIAGQQRKNKVISPKEKKIVAYHEIGHALVAAKQTDSAPVTKITIIPRTSGALGYTMQVNEEDVNLVSKEEAYNKIVTLTGGRSAEEIVFGTVTTGASNDIEQITKKARAMITRYGMSDEFDMMALETFTSPYMHTDTQLSCGPETAARIDDEVLSLIKGAHKKALGILEENRALMDKLAAYLLEKETITGEQFMEVMRLHKLETEAANVLPAVAPPTQDNPAQASAEPIA